MLIQIFLYQTPVQPETFIYQGKEQFSYIRTHTTFFRSDFRIYVAQKQGAFDDQDLIITWGKKISAMINDWENNIAYWKNPSKAGPWLLASVIRFMLYVNSQLMGLGAQSQQKHFAVYTLIYVWKQYFQLLNWHKIVTNIIMLTFFLENC